MEARIGPPEGPKLTHFSSGKWKVLGEFKAMKSLSSSLLLINIFQPARTWLLNASLCFLSFLQFCHLVQHKAGSGDHPYPCSELCLSLSTHCCGSLMVCLCSYGILVPLRTGALLVHWYIESACYHDWCRRNACYPTGDWSTLSWLSEVCSYECELQSECLQNSAPLPAPHPTI